MCSVKLKTYNCLSKVNCSFLTTEKVGCCKAVEFTSNVLGKLSYQNLITERGLTIRGNKKN